MVFHAYCRNIFVHYVFVGEVLRGDRIVTTPYQVRGSSLLLGIASPSEVSSMYAQVRVMQNDSCSILCSMELTRKNTAVFIERIDEDYTVHM